MFDKLSRELILQAILNEHQKASEVYGGVYNSPHEGWAVMKEEIDEAEHELEMLRGDNMLFWDSVRHNSYGVMQDSIDKIQERAVNAILELTQVVSCCMKMTETIKGLKG